MWMVEDVFHLSNYHVLPEVEEKKQTSITSELVMIKMYTSVQSVILYIIGVGTGGGMRPHIILLGGAMLAHNLGS